MDALNFLSELFQNHDNFGIMTSSDGSNLVKNEKRHLSTIKLFILTPNLI